MFITLAQTRPAPPPPHTHTPPPPPVFGDGGVIFVYNACYIFYLFKSQWHGFLSPGAPISAPSLRPWAALLLMLLFTLTHPGCNCERCCDSPLVEPRSGQVPHRSIPTSSKLPALPSFKPCRPLSRLRDFDCRVTLGMHLVEAW